MITLSRRRPVWGVIDAERSRVLDRIPVDTHATGLRGFFRARLTHSTKTDEGGHVPSKGRTKPTRQAIDLAVEDAGYAFPRLYVLSDERDVRAGTGRWEAWLSFRRPGIAAWAGVNGLIGALRSRGIRTTSVYVRMTVDDIGQIVTKASLDLESTYALWPTR